MRAYREDLPARTTRSRPYPVIIGVAALVVVALLFAVMRDSAAPLADSAQANSEAPLPDGNAGQSVDLAVDSMATAEPQTAASQISAPQAAPQTPPATASAFGARQLPPPRTTVSGGEAPVVERENNDDFFVIDGELLETLEAEAPPRPVIE